MKKNYSEFKIGLSVILALVILIGAIIWGKGYALTAKSVKVEVRFSDIAGLEEGAYVLVNGLRKGKVQQFVLEQKDVLVRLSLDQKVKLNDDAVFEITSPDLMGGKVVNISPGTSGFAPTPGYIFVGKAGGGMNELMRMSSSLVDDVKRLLGVLEATAVNINKTAGDPRLQEAFLSSVNNLDKSSQRTLELITINEGKLNEVMDNLVVTTNSVRGLIENSSGEFSQSVIEFHTFVTELNRISQDVHQVVNQLNNNDGTLGQLINQGDLADDLKHTLAGIDSLVAQIRYEGLQTNVSLFGSKKPKPPRPDKDKGR
jgi:phospholipid/cholesterol/gamma-HCH transport system substrate-binding protein